ncbi:MAG: aspartate kinase [Candidatus Diapherotrites archaeon]|mgnify:CR=1 FL=1|jgi:aspartate kinase|uniref:Aspartokinase n=1 Tax=Candidatus Iainarchaeum sp. TaxID=3101447 RepID=A0A8T5GDV8_9ARCH|nr:aspartate kinase [Candidatus Diapherotrites archaeon]MBT7241017.1 aspartate kinase [Candidatus Diapherotrites archaeon]
METTVLKIGGGILRDKDCFDRVVNIVKQNKENGTQQILVLSALYGVTDFLIESTHKSLHSDKEIEATIHKLKEMHKQYIGFVENKEVKEKAEFEIDDKISILEKFLYGVSYLKELSPRSKDMIQSYGERLSPIVLEAILNDHGVDAKFVDAEDAGIYCKGDFEKALVEMNSTTKALHENISPLLKENIILLPGYYGIDDAEVKTFGRGGTDYSAGVLANVFSAKLEIWKDVSGFMSADPKAVKDAVQINNLSYDEAEELGYLGAKILHPKTIAPLREKELFAEIKNLFDPDKKGTTISGKKDVCDLIVKSIATNKDIGIITVKSSSMVNSPGFASKIFRKLAEKEIPIDLICTGETAVSFSVNESDIEAAAEQLQSLNDTIPCTISSEKELAMIGIIGECMKDSKGIAGKLFTAMGENNINVELISQGASEINISFVVNRNNVDKAVEIAHKTFMGE